MGQVPFVSAVTCDTGKRKLNPGSHNKKQSSQRNTWIRRNHMRTTTRTESTDSHSRDGAQPQAEQARGGEWPNAAPLEAFTGPYAEPGSTGHHELDHSREGSRTGCARDSAEPNLETVSAGGRPILIAGITSRHPRRVKAGPSDEGGERGVCGPGPDTSE